MRRPGAFDWWSLASYSLDCPVSGESDGESQGQPMTAMEFILVAHAILTGLGIAEVLRGFGDLIRESPERISRRLLAIAFWALLLYLQIWWAIWRVGTRDAWTFPDFLTLLLPVVILYLVARVLFPRHIDDADLDAHYQRVSPALWLLIAGVYLSFIILQPLLYGTFVPGLIATQVGIAIGALVAIRVRHPGYQVVLISVMFVQMLWRGLVLTIGG